MNKVMASMRWDRSLDLRQGETATTFWTASDHHDRSFWVKLLGIFHPLNRTKTFVVALTDQNRLAIGKNKQRRESLATYEVGEVRVEVTPIKPRPSRTAGPKGLERARVVLLTPASGQPYRLVIAASGSDALVAWAAAGSA